MTKKTFKSQASSSRAVSSSNAVFGGSSSSTLLSHTYEPPDLSGISAPQIVVSLKNLQKKDSITKTKALEDLFKHLFEADGELDAATINAWISLYPRASIDNARRVRQLAHTLHGQISQAAGKRIAKHMPKIVGAWLAGKEDPDHLVAKAADEAWRQLFVTETKQREAWRAYQSSILEFCTTAILKETSLSLSDERTTSPDDAAAKYARVVGSNVKVVTTALNTLSSEEVASHLDQYRDLLLPETMWKLSTHSESFVRQSIYGLLLSVIRARHTDLLGMDVISSRVLQAGLHTEQIGSVERFLEMLVELSTMVPEVWTSRYSGTGKKAASRRLCQFLRKGSRGSSQFWMQLLILLKLIPREVLLPDDLRKGDDSDHLEASSVLDAFHQGIIQRETPKSSLEAAWKAYLEFAKHLVLISNDDHRAEELMRSSVVPLIRQHIKPNPQEASWDLAGDEEELAASASQLVLRFSKLFSEVFENLSKTIVEDLKSTLPEQSRHFKTSQEAVISEVRRWYKLQARLLDFEDQLAAPVFKKTARQEAQAAVGILESRDGKPYSAAAMLYLAISITPTTITTDQSTIDVLRLFAKDQVPRLIMTPSATAMLKFLDSFRAFENVENILHSAIKAVLESSNPKERATALSALASSSWLSEAGISDDLTKMLKESLQRAVTGDEDSWLPIQAIWTNSNAPVNLLDDMLASLTAELFIETW